MRDYFNVSELLKHLKRYGVRGSEMKTRYIMIGMVTLFLALFFVSLFRDLPQTILGRTQNLSGNIEPREFAYALEVICAILAGACGAIIALHTSETSVVRDLESGETRSRDLEPSNPRLRNMTIVLVALFSAVVAAIGFASIYAVSNAEISKLLTWNALIAATMQLITCAVLLGFSFILFIPMKSLLCDDMVRTFAYSCVALILFPAFLMFATPGMGYAYGPLVFLALFLIVGQVLYPHGLVVSKEGFRPYEERLDYCRSTANSLIASSTLISTIIFLIAMLGDSYLCQRRVQFALCLPVVLFFVLAVYKIMVFSRLYGFILLLAPVAVIRFWGLLTESPSDGITLITLYGLTTIWSAGLLSLQIWVEGTRKLTRYK